MPVIAPALSPSGAMVVVVVAEVEGVALVLEAAAGLSQRLPVYSLGQLEERHYTSQDHQGAGPYPL